MKKPLESCANGCGVPPCPPSLVICRACMDRIGATLDATLKRLDERRGTR